MRNPIRVGAVSQRSALSEEQVQLFAALCEDLVGAARQQPRVKFRDLKEYERLMLGAYACGFVCRDITPTIKDFAPYIEDPRKLMEADFLVLRRFVHYMMRGERHGDCGEEYGGGFIHEAAISGSLEAVALRLTTTPEWRA